MKLSSVDINNPIYEKPEEPGTNHRKFVESMEDDKGDTFRVEIEYSYYRYDGIVWIFFYSFKPLDTFYMTKESMDESVRESFYLYEGAVRFECEGQMIN